MVSLDDRLDYLLTDRSIKYLDEIFGIRTVGELLRHYPRSYVQGVSKRGLDDDDPPEEKQHITIVDVITNADSGRMRKTGRKFLRITVGSGKGRVTATFFNAEYLMRDLTVDTRVMLSGEVGYYRNALQLTHPAFLILDSRDGKNHGTKSLRAIADTSGEFKAEDAMNGFENRFFAIYPASAKLQSWDIFSCVRQVLALLDPIPDPLPAELVAARGLMSEDEALRAIHLAEDEVERDRARERLTFDEAVGLQWALFARRNSELAQSGPAAPARDGLTAKLLQQLPFELTAGQREVLAELSSELARTRPLNRLLQGEVGSGKTIVSVLAMLQMVDSGYQCALLAPTEVLAAQHLRSITEVLGPLALGGQLGGADDATRVALLTGSMTAAQKKQVRADIAGGQVGIVVGTHALLQDAVEFQNLGMVVVDEQHRFGVEQRDRLRAKAPGGLTPHLLVMTATPIPRTVALTVYGDLETSTLRELPRGRQPITTNVILVKEKPAWLERAWQRIREEVAAGRQAYVVAPRIDENDESFQAEDETRPTATAEGLFAGLYSGALSGLRLGLMHGRLPADEKDAAMAAFRSGEIDVLVCTTVIEVGVDVPNATVMLVMDADRFGISQLHQLRGRIGRGQHAGLCLLASWSSPGSSAARRLKAVAATQDGFALAALDLKERKEGDVLGRNQSGKAITLRLLSLADHEAHIEAAREFCLSAFAADPADAGLSLLAARFTDTDQIEYLDKA